VTGLFAFADALGSSSQLLSARSAGLPETACNFCAHLGDQYVSRRRARSM